MAQHKIYELQSAATSAMSNLNPYHSTAALRKIAGVIESQLDSAEAEASPALRCLLSQVFGHLASMSLRYGQRAGYRGRAIRTCSDGLRANQDSSTLAVAYADAVVTWAYDPLTPPDRDKIITNLASAWRNCKRALELSNDKSETINLLSQWSSVLRCQAHMHGRREGKRYILHALDISRAGISQDESSAIANLDYGLTLWSAARWANTEDEFYQLNQSAEKHLKAAHDSGLSIATLCIARFYRQTFRPIQAIKWFSEYSKREPRARLVLSEAHIAGEAAVMLLHRDLEPDAKSVLLADAEDFLSRGIEAGYKNARVLIALARLRYARGDDNGGTFFLHEIVSETGLHWTEAVEVARRAILDDDVDYVRNAFAIGLTEGVVWNGLATFTKEVLKDNDFALRLYDVALRLNSSSAMIHTNVARLLLEINNRDSYPKIQRHLELAGVNADFAFRWWRPLKNELSARLTGSQNPRAGYPAKRKGETLDRIYADFIALDKLVTDAHDRGKKFEELFVRILGLTYGIDRVAGSATLAGMQSDATFKHGSYYYRTEISWDSRPNDRSEVDKLVARLNRTTGTRGLLVSMSGFTEGVAKEIKYQMPNHVILVISPEEIREVLKGSVRLESLIEEKEANLFLSAVA